MRFTHVCHHICPYAAFLLSPMFAMQQLQCRRLHDCSQVTCPTNSAVKQLQDFQLNIAVLSTPSARQPYSRHLLLLQLHSMPTQHTSCSCCLIAHAAAYALAGAAWPDGAAAAGAVLGSAPAAFKPAYMASICSTASSAQQRTASSSHCSTAENSIDTYPQHSNPLRATVAANIGLHLV